MLFSTRFALLMTLLMASRALGAPPDFERDIAPIFSAKCLKCHGADAPAAGLSLASRSGALRTPESGEAALTPGQTESSGLLQRVTTSEATLRMPPAGEPLSPKEVERLREWIAAGADWPDHWAYRPLQVVTPPTLTHDPEWPRTPVDAFVAEGLHGAGLAPNPAASGTTLVRRLFIDLWGLPPTPEDVAESLADERPDALERLVDRLLASPHYGERQARHWMDLVHFAETHGHDQDRPREHAWPFRDALIRAFNADLPYDQLVARQVAGDVLLPDDPEALALTGLLSAGSWDESSLRDIREDTLDREIARYLDRDDILTTVMNTFASTTVQCARCHDHKFDPIPQAEYYALQAVFADTGKGNRLFDVSPEVASQRRALQQSLAALPERLKSEDPTLLADDLQAAIGPWSERLAAEARRWQRVSLQSWQTVSGTVLTPQPDNSLLASGNRPDTETLQLTFAPPVPRVTGLLVEVLSDPTLPQQGPGRQDNGNLHLNEIVLWAINTAEPEQRRKLELADAEADFNQDGWTISHAIDGNPATAWGIYPQVGRSHRAALRLKEPAALAPGTLLMLELQQTHGGGHVIGRVRLSATGENEVRLTGENRLAEEVREALLTPAVERSAGQRRQLAAAWIEQRDQASLAALPPQQQVYCGSNQFEVDGSFKPTPQTREVRVLHRGEITQPKDVARPGALSLISNLTPAFEQSAGTDASRRAALAAWLTSPDNVLTWRSIANRLWQQHFSRGLVDTPSDFGRMGSAPSHPALLDWLARDLQFGDGSLKRMHRRLISSATWRQSSQIRPEAVVRDADNRLLWRMHSSRLDAETIRDAALVLGDTLDDTLGGPSVRQFIQMPGVASTPIANYLEFDVDSPAYQRRSVYRFLFRTMPDPFMDAMDCPDGSQLTPVRGESLTALQALATLNDKLLVRQATRIAERLSVQAAAPYEPTQRAFQLVLLREPVASELLAAANYVDRHGLANFVRVLLNSNEFLFVD